MALGNWNKVPSIHRGELVGLKSSDFLALSGKRENANFYFCLKAKAMYCHLQVAASNLMGTWSDKKDSRSNEEEEKEQ